MLISPPGQFLQVENCALFLRLSALCCFCRNLFLDEASSEDKASATIPSHESFGSACVLSQQLPLIR